MKNTKKVALFLSSIIISFTALNCSEDNDEVAPEESTTITPTLIRKPKPKEEPKRGRTLNPENKKPTIIEKDGQIRAEYEIGSIDSDWKFISADEEKFSGSREDGYIAWTGEQFLGNPGNGIIEYTLKITTPGEYIFKHRVRITKIDPDPGKAATEHNDVWLRFPDADGFFARSFDGTNIIYPKGGVSNPPGTTSFPMGASGDGWFKIFYNKLAWGWAAGTSDFQGYPVSVQFDSAGEYKMQISARSSYLGLDEFALKIGGFNDGDTIIKSEVTFPE